MTGILGNCISLGVLAAMVVAGAVLGEYWAGFLARCASWIYLAISFSLAYSFAGIPSITQATLFAIGAYTMVWCAPILGGELLALLPLGAASGAAGALVVGVLVIRMSRNGAAIATIILSVVAFVFGNAAVPLTGGANGLALPSLAYSLLGVPVPAGPNLATLLLGTALLALLLAALWLAMQSHAWMVVRAIQENEIRARVLGYDVGLYRLAVFALSGAVAGLGGALYALVSLHVTTDLLTLLMSFKAILWAVVGGVGAVFGGPIGVLVIQVASELLSRWTLRVDLVIGLLLILTALALPNGLMGVFATLGERLHWRRRATGPDGPRTRRKRS